MPSNSCSKAKSWKNKNIFKFRFKYGIRLKIEEDESMPLGQVKFFSNKTQKELTDDVI